MKRTLCIILLLMMTMGQAAYSETIAEIKSLPLGVPVVVEGVVTWIRGFDCYIQSEDRISGIWVQGSNIGISMGEKVTAAGTLAMQDYELVITEASLYPTGYAQTIAPFAMPNKAVAGAYAFQQFRVQDRVSFKIPGDGIGQRWDYAGGASNVGMLVKTWGKVVSTYYSTGSDLKYFYIDDGSGVTGDFGDRGILVYSSAEVKQGDVVSVTGVSCIELALDQPDKLIRVLRPRWTGDVEVLKSAEPAHPYPFSDEFNGTEIDPRWTVVAGIDRFAVESGNLVLIPELTYMSYNSTYIHTGLAQILPENCDLEIKVELSFANDPLYKSQYVTLALSTFDGSHFWHDNLPLIRAFSVIRTKGSPDILWIGYPERQNYLPLTGTSFLFCMSKRGSVTSAKISYDGLSFSDEYTFTGSPILTLYAGADKTTSSGEPVDQFKAYIDYIRITPVNE